MATRDKGKLTVKQQKFVEGVLSGRNGTVAARRAGYKGNDNTLGAIASENLRKPKIRERIQARMREAAVHTDEVIGTLVSHMRADIGDILGDMLPGEPILAAARAKGLSHLIKKLKIRRRTIPVPNGEPIQETLLEIEIHDSQAAARQLCAVFGLNKETARNLQDLKASAEIAVQEFIRRTGADRKTAIEHLAPFIPLVSELVN